MIMSEQKIECTRTRACGWKGIDDDLVDKPNEKQTKKYGFGISDRVCPSCGCKTMYDIKD